jgi:hypothetical protein
MYSALSGYTLGRPEDQCPIRTHRQTARRPSKRVREACLRNVIGKGLIVVTWFRGLFGEAVQLSPWLAIHLPETSSTGAYLRKQLLFCLFQENLRVSQEF